MNYKRDDETLSEALDRVRAENPGRRVYYFLNGLAPAEVRMIPEEK